MQLLYQAAQKSQLSQKAAQLSPLIGLGLALTDSGPSPAPNKSPKSGHQTPLQFSPAQRVDLLIIGRSRADLWTFILDDTLPFLVLVIIASLVRKHLCQDVTTTANRLEDPNGIGLGRGARRAGCVTLRLR